MRSTFEHSFQITQSTVKDLASSFPPSTGRPSTSSVSFLRNDSPPGTNAEDSFQQFLKAYRKHDFNLRYLTVLQNHLSLPNINHFFETLKKTQIPTLQTLTLGPLLSIPSLTEESLTDSGMGALLDISRTRALTSLKKLVLQSTCRTSLRSRLQCVVHGRVLAGPEDPRGGISAAGGVYGEA